MGEPVKRELIHGTYVSDNAGKEEKTIWNEI